MTRELRREELIPSAARLLSSLRDLGYDFVTAVADLVDNSVTANAGRVDITIQFAGPDSWVRIADDGNGMAGGDIVEALRLGSGGREYGEDDLGKFGLGLKTASLSQARSITVASRRNAERRAIDCRLLDLDDVISRDKWEIITPTAVDRPAEAVAPLQSSTGTVVVWHNLDRVLSKKDPFGGWAQRHLLGLAERLDAHLGMVFGRFISGQARRRKKLTITVNGTKVEPWDPFCQDETTEELPSMEIPVGGSFVRWRPFVLPSQREFSDEDAWKRASGPRQWNLQQGLYIYRADRMIQSGGWSWLRSSDEHLKLARAGLEFWPALDEAFEINISKMRVKLPEDLREQLKPLVSFLTKRADDRYRSSAKIARPAPPARPPSPPRPTPTAAITPTPAAPVRHVLGGTQSVAGIGTSSTPGERPALADVGSALTEAASRAGVDAALSKIRDELRLNDEQVARDLGW